MRLVRFLGCVLGLVVLSRGNVMGFADDRLDVHSYGNPQDVRVTHISLDLTVNFEKKQLAGTATLSLERKPSPKPEAELAKLMLDDKGLVIEKIESSIGPGPRSERRFFQSSEKDPILGEPIAILLPKGHDRVRITYQTAPGAGALQWLEPSRTAGKVKPFLFTQSQAIQARTWIPTQDSPGVRVTYDAKIHVPPGLTAVMSAESLPKGPDPTVFEFEMKQPIPSYLISLAVGDLAFKPIGPRTGVWAEPSMVAKAAFEFADTEKMVEATEKRFGPYRWGRYDILVLPPSFPFGGMENPRLTFATPTVLAGDRSLVALVAHELAHSWSGNLVTNATWRDFWLNEGFTVYLERRIVEDVYGPARAKIEAVLGIQELRDDMTRLPSSDQILHIQLAGRDPDDGMTQVPYEKGALFLTELERAFGREKFDAFLLDYFNRHAFQSITTDVLLADLKTKLFPLDPEAASKIDLKAWTESPGLKVPFVEPKSPELEAVDRFASEWSAGRVKASEIPVSNWSTQEWLRFLRALPEKMPEARMTELDEAFGLTKRGNSEIAALWLQMAIINEYHPADTRLEEFLTSIGRRKFLMPLYRALLKTPEGTAKARAIYSKARPFYHPIAVESVDKLLGVKSGENAKN
jgi:leukotriene-A4 hydrolase